MSDVEANKKVADNEIASKMLSIHYKRFYIDVKQNQRGRFIKIAERGAIHKSRVSLSMSAAANLVELLGDYITFGKENPEETNKEGKTEAVALKSDIMNFETRRYYLDLKENSRGRFLRIAQANNTPRPTRSQVAIPMMGLAEVKEVIEDFISQFGEGFMDTPAELADSKHIRTDLNKSFFFDTSENERGSYVRISEVKPKSGYRTQITVPASSLVQFRETISELIEKLNLETSPQKTDLET